MAQEQDKNLDKAYMLGASRDARKSRNVGFFRTEHLTQDENIGSFELSIQSKVPQYNLCLDSSKGLEGLPPPLNTVVLFLAGMPWTSWALCHADILEIDIQIRASW